MHLALNHSVSSTRVLTALSCGEDNCRTRWTLVLGIEDTYLCGDVSERPQIVDMTRVDISALTRLLTARRRPASTWLPVDDTVFLHCLQAFSRLPELNL